MRTTFNSFLAENTNAKKKADIEYFLQQAGLSKNEFKILPDLSVDIYDRWYFSGEKYHLRLPIKINSISKDEILHLDNVTTLVGTPTEIKKLEITNSTLKNLNDLPRFVQEDDSFFCIRKTKLGSLEGAPNFIGKLDFDEVPGLTSLKFIPNKLVSLIMSSCDDLKSLDYFPESIKIFYIDSCKRIDNFHNIHKTINFKQLNQFTISKMNIKKQILGMYYAFEAGVEIKHSWNNKEFDDALKIIKNAVDKKDTILDCQEALMEAGFEDYAQL
jgi:hypothetical protein